MENLQKRKYNNQIKIKIDNIVAKGEIAHYE